jgi:glycosyltransferase involved in cell wall biosynthesis
MMVPERKIKILYLIECLFGFGGTEKHLFQLVTRLNRDKFECIVCPIQFGPEMVNVFREAGVNVVPLPFERIYGFSAATQALKLFRLLKQQKVDVLQSFNVDSDIYGAVVAKLAGTPIIISSRRDLGAYRKEHHQRVTKITNRHVSHFIAVCGAVAETISKMDGIASERISTIYNGIDLADLSQIDDRTVKELRSKFNITSKSFVIGNVAHFRPEKGHQVFFEAIRKVKSKIPELRVLNIGDGDSLPDFQREINEDGLAGNVFFTGYVEKVLDYLSVMDISCLTPISNEGFSNALLEHMAMGKAIIATAVGGNREAIVNGESGIIIPPNDVDALAKAILELHGNAKRRAEMGQNAKTRVQSHFGIDKMISQMEKLYCDLANRNSDRREKRELTSNLQSVETANQAF